MAIKAVTRYESDDGKLHDDIGEARKHDSMQRSLQKIRQALGTSSPGGSFGTLAIDLLNSPKNAELLRDALNATLNSHRVYGKLKKPAVSA